jgi:hypothetical protein
MDDARTTDETPVKGGKIFSMLRNTLWHCHDENVKRGGGIENLKFKKRFLN